MEEINVNNFKNITVIEMENLKIGDFNNTKSAVAVTTTDNKKTNLLE